jgi:hypothetical protein
MAGAYPIVQGYAKGQARNRQFTAVSATVETATWDDGVNEVTITVIQEAAGTAELKASVGVCFGAPSPAAAEAWLTYAESKAADSGMVILVPGVPRTFYFSGAGITRLDLKRLFGSEALGVLVEAA